MSYILFAYSFFFFIFFFHLFIFLHDLSFCFQTMLNLLRSYKDFPLPLSILTGVSFIRQDTSWARKAWWTPLCCPQPRDRAVMRWKSPYLPSRARSGSFFKSSCGWRCKRRWTHKRAARKIRWADHQTLFFFFVIHKRAWSDGSVLWHYVLSVSGGRLVDEDFRKLHPEQKVMNACIYTDPSSSKPQGFK